MMKKMLVVLLTGIIVSSCFDKDKTITQHDLNGAWQITSYQTFSPELPEIEKNDIIWTFNVIAEKLGVANNIEADYPFILASGDL